MPGGSPPPNQKTILRFNPGGRSAQRTLRQGPLAQLLGEHTRPAIARTQLDSNEARLHIESRRFETAQV